MKPEVDLTSRMVGRLFAELKRSGIRYAVLRNYDQILSLRVGQTATDIDMVVDSRDLPAWRTLLARIAGEEHWDALTECDHWARSSVREHNIEVFRLYRYDPLDFIQIDLFHSYVLLGVPLVDEGNLLAGRRLHPSGFFCVDRVHERTFALLQIKGLFHSDPANPKIERYRARALETWKSEPARMRASLRSNFPFFGGRAMRALQNGELRRFAHLMGWAKLAFLVRWSVRHPFRSVRCALARARENRGRFRTRQCGFVLRVHAPGPSGHERFGRVMDEIAKADCIDSWKAKAAGATNEAEHAVMEQGGIIVEWTGRDAADLALDEQDGRDAILRRLLDLLIARHRALFLRAAGERRER